MKHFLLVFVAAMFLMACNHSDKKTVERISHNDTTIKSVTTVKHKIDTLTIPEDTIPKVIIPDSAIQVAEDKVDSTSKVKIVEETDYNAQDSVGPKDAKLNWKGIFYNKGNYYIKPTKIHFTKEHSEFDDDDKPEQKTGWRLTCSVKDSCFSLISGVDNLITGNLKLVNLKYFYYAGQKQEFKYEGVIYTIYSTGTKRDGKISNLKLYLTANVKGHVFNQLLISLGNNVELDGGETHPVINLSLIGDIDGDKIPDFIVKEFGYPFESTSLYLSRPAGNNAIVKLVGYLYTSD
jgi:hypothetical protein